MTTLVDLVNFNADASCLSTTAWLRALDGGAKSTMCRWLELYVAQDKKIALGFTGATIADMRALNPEAPRADARRPARFEPIVRPFGTTSRSCAVATRSGSTWSSACARRQA